MRFLYSFLLLFFFLSTLFITGCGKKPLTEKEPNNAFASATAIELGKTVQGYMDSSDDRDAYMLSLQTEGVLDVSLSGLKGINLAIQVWKGGPEPEMVKIIDDARKSSPEKLANLHVTAGPWYIVILHGERDRKKSNKEIPYKFTASMRDFISEESEPNDSHAEATLILFDHEINGYFSPSYNRKNQQKENTYREEDWFVFNAEIIGESPLMVDVTLTEVPGVNSLLEIYGPDMNLISRSDENPAGGPEMLKSIGLKNAGKYYILVTAHSFQSNHDMPYSLKVTGNPHVPGTELEPNDSPDSAMIVKDATVTAAINRESDIDYFLYEKTDITSLYRIEVSTPSGQGDVYLKILDRNRNEIVRIDNETGEGKEVHPNLHLQVPFYCGVYWKNAASGENRTYTLTIENLKNYKNMEIEPNNSIETATPVTGDIATGYISSRDDKDFFLLKTKGGKRKRLKFLIKGVEGGELKAGITDPMGYALKTVTIQGNEEQEVIETIDRRGYVIISPVRGTFETPYSIQIRGID